MYYDGEYHLFFQHNPLGLGWGNMTWGHAVSTDMVRWKQLPHAILPYGNGYVFSGTGVVDHNNSLGKQVGDTKTLVLLYSYALDTRQRFGILPAPSETMYHQGMAYSTDRGRTFKLIDDGGPVIPNQGRDVDPRGTQRDPKLFWHEPSRKWVTVLWMGEKSGGRVRFFNSDDLLNWNMTSEMTRPWAHECFDLVELDVLDAEGKPVSGGEPKKKWLIYDGNLDYEVAAFDGKTFTAEQPVRNHKLGQWNAAQTFNNSPDGRTVIIGWLTGSNFPAKGMPFSQQLSFPATMHLQKVSGEYRLCRWPIKEIESLYTRTWNTARQHQRRRGELETRRDPGRSDGYRDRVRPERLGLGDTDPWPQTHLQRREETDPLQGHTTARCPEKRDRQAPDPGRPRLFRDLSQWRHQRR